MVEGSRVGVYSLGISSSDLGFSGKTCTCIVGNGGRDYRDRYSGLRGDCVGPTAEYITVV